MYLSLFYHYLPFTAHIHIYQAKGMDPSLYATHWFNTLFSYSMPFGHVIRIWDIYMVEVGTSHLVEVWHISPHGWMMEDGMGGMCNLIFHACCCRHSPQGIKIVFRTALAILRLAERRLMGCRDFEALTRELSAKVCHTPSALE